MSNLTPEEKRALAGPPWWAWAIIAGSVAYGLLLAYLGL